MINKFTYGVVYINTATKRLIKNKLSICLRLGDFPASITGKLTKLFLTVCTHDSQLDATSQKENTKKSMVQLRRKK